MSHQDIQATVDQYRRSMSKVKCPTCGKPIQPPADFDADYFLKGWAMGRNHEEALSKAITAEHKELKDEIDRLKSLLEKEKATR